MEEIRATALPRRERWDALFGDRIPKATDLVFPDCVFAGQLILEVGGITIQIDEHGPAESGAHTVVYVEEDETLITGDIVDSKKHPWIGERHIDDWCEKLKELPQRYRIRSILPGHGAPGGPDLLEETSEWLINYKRVGRGSILSREPLTSPKREWRRLSQEIVSNYPDYFLPRWGDKTNLSIGLRKLDTSFVGNIAKPIRTPEGRR